MIEFEELVRRGEMERAASRYEGPFLAGFRLSAVPEFESWMEDERRALEAILATALARLSSDARNADDPTAVVRWMRRLVALEPLNARVTVDLMRALLDAGGRADALQQARIYEALVAQSLDLPPDELVLSLVRDIREGRAAPAAPPQPVPVAAAPRHATPPPSTLPVAVDVSAATATIAPTAAPSEGELSVAVVPFTAIPDDASGRTFRDGLMEELLSSLGGRAELRVTGRWPRIEGSVEVSVQGSLERKDASRFDHPDAAALLEGAVRVVGDDVRVTARLLHARSGTVLWTERFNRHMHELLAVQDELAAAIADGAERGMRNAAGLPRAPSARARADALYAEGMRAWTPQGAGLGQGLEEFRQAIAIDPSHARAHAALAESYTQLAFYGFLPARRAAALVDAASREAMRLAPDLAEAHLARGTSLLWVDREFDAGTQALVRALELDPTLVVAQARLAFVRLCHDGPFETELDVALRAATAVGASGLSRVMYGQQLLPAGRYDEAIEALHAAIDIEAPSFLACHWLSAAYVETGRGSEAVAAAVAEASISDRHPWSLTSLVVACAVAGQRRRAETLLTTLKTRAATTYVQVSLLGLAHAALGDLEAGMSYLERAVDEHDPSMMMVRTFPTFASFRRHPRFRSLLRRAGWRDWDTAEFRVPDA